MKQLQLEFETEKWKPIVGYEGLYEVSNFGNVKSLKNKIIMSQNLDRYGYYHLHLSKNGIKKTYSTHRLVAEAFVPNPNKYPQVNHIDECKKNNNANNLEWCTSEYNCNYGNHNQRMKETKRKVYETMFKPIRCIESMKIYDNPNEIDNDGYKRGFVYSCCRCDIESAYGLHWEYA